MQPITNRTIFDLTKPFLPAEEREKHYAGIQIHLDPSGDSYILSLVSGAHNLWQRTELNKKLTEALFFTLVAEINVPDVGVKKIDVLCDGGNWDKPSVTVEMTPLPKKLAKIHLSQIRPDGTEIEVGIQDVYDLPNMSLIAIKTDANVETKKAVLNQLIDQSGDDMKFVCLFLPPDADLSAYKFEVEKP